MTGVNEEVGSGRKAVKCCAIRLSKGWVYVGHDLITRRTGEIVEVVKCLGLGLEFDSSSLGLPGIVLKCESRWSMRLSSCPSH